jgi:hypothetical protein
MMMIKMFKITVLWDMEPCTLGDRYSPSAAQKQMEGGGSSETLVLTYYTTRRHILENRSFVLYCHENFNPHATIARLKIKFCTTYHLIFINFHFTRINLWITF